MDTDFSLDAGRFETATPHEEFLSRVARIRDGEFDLARQFIEYLYAKAGVEDSYSAPPESSADTPAIDWDSIQSAAAQAESVEHSVGRAVVLADTLARQTTRAAVEPDPHLAAPDEFFSYDAGALVPDFGDDARVRDGMARFVTTHRAMLSFALAMVLILTIATLAVVPTIGQSLPSAFRGTHLAAIEGNAPFVSGAHQSATRTAPTVPVTAQEASAAGPPSPGATAAVSLPAASGPPAPAPPSLAGAPPLRPHEVFGFAPYWTLGQSGGFNVSQLTTIAYFSVGVNPDGSLSESGPGWEGLQSQALADLVTRAHAAGDRVVLTVNCFDQSALNQLTSSATAPLTLSGALVNELQAKNLDGVNIDFEGQGSGDQAGLTNLVTAVASAVHGVNPHYQVTMDTYASAAGDANGFYNIRALAPAVDGFFVMDYELNLQATPSSASPLTSSQFSESTSAGQYAAAVPPSKVILGLPYFGVDWPTSDGTLTAHATGPATPLTDSQILSSGNPIYWDATTDTAWTSYQVGSQWHESFFEDPQSLYDAAKLAGADNLGGVGIWALGMDGNDPAMLAALLGFSPPVKDLPAGPASTSASPVTAGSVAGSSSTTSTDASAGSGSVSATDSTTSTSPDASSSTSSTSTSTSSTSTSTSTTDASGPAYRGIWNGQTVTLTPITFADPDIGSAAGELTNFATNDYSYQCLANAPSLPVRELAGSPNRYYVVTQTPGSCVTAYFTFTAS